MTQPGPDEISQGTDTGRRPAAERLTSSWPAWRARLRRPRVLLAAGAAVALVIAGAVAGVALSRPSYPHPWCAPVLAALQAHDPELGYAAALARLQRRDRAPVGRLLSALDVYIQDQAIEQDGDDLTRLGNFTATRTARHAVESDLRVLAGTCGQPGGGYRGDVP